MSSRLWVVGSAVVDNVHQVDRMPTPGNSVFATRSDRYLGGKGSNQAVAAARCGTPTSLIVSLGDDPAADDFHAVYQAENLETTYVVRQLGMQTGHANVCVDATGQNQISIFVGANGAMTADHVLAAPIVPEDIVLCQLEVPDEAVLAASSRGRFILNPAPMRPLPQGLLETVWIITPNQAEASDLAGHPVHDLPTARSAAQKIQNLGPQEVIITLGPLGALWLNDQGDHHFPAPQVQAIDTTGAGDAFNGALAARLCQGHPLPAAIPYAIKAATHSVTKPGAIPSMPHSLDLT